MKHADVSQTPLARAALATTFALLVIIQVLVVDGRAEAGILRRILRQPPVGIQLTLLLTDGTVMAQSRTGRLWYRYAPDAFGDYQNGTWTRAASLQTGYSPTAFASAVLADGRLVISGGEYNSPGNYDLQLTNLGAVYNPVDNTWTPLGHPKDWRFIGDSPGSVLPGGQFLIGQKITRRAAYLDPKTLRWTSVSTHGKQDFNAEEGWTLLPDGSILTLDVKNAPHAERYIPSMSKWISAGSTIVDLHSPTSGFGCAQYGPKLRECYYPPGEIGPAILRPDGTVFCTGSSSGASGFGTGHTAVYHTLGSLAGQWTVGPDFPNGDNAGDSFAALLPSGNVFVIGVSHQMYEFDGSKFITEGASGGPPLLLPTGQVMMFGSSLTLYTPSGMPQASWAPQVTRSPKTVMRGQTYRISGRQFNGLSQAMSFGDEFQNATNYPLVRITNKATGHVFYARTHDHTSMGVATGSLIVSTSVDIAPATETGASTLQVVANGIGSIPVQVTVK